MVVSLVISKILVEVLSLVTLDLVLHDLGQN